MARRIPEDLVERVRQSADIVDLVSEYVQLKRVGRSYVGLCPFHPERTPSFTVSREKQLFHCFGCKAGGTVIHFVMEMERLSFAEAVRKLAARAGIDLPDPEEEGEESGWRSRALRAYELAAKWYQHLLLNTPYGRPGTDYLQRRNIGTATAQSFQLGLAPAQGDALLSFLERRGYDRPFLLEAGLAAGGEDRGYFDRFRRRLMFPIWDGQGRVIAFGGRIIGDGEPKYLNSPETPLFHKGRHLYPWHRARTAIRRARRALLLEGYMDVVAMHQAGFTEAVASLGTGLTAEQAALLKRATDDVVVVYDGDEAGSRAALRAAEVLRSAGLQVRIARLPAGRDPDDLLRERGPQAIERILAEETMGVTAYRLALARDKAALVRPEDRAAFLRQALEVLAEGESAVEVETLLKNLAEEFHISLEALRHDLYEIRRKKADSRDKRENKWNTNIDPVTSSLTRQTPPHIAAERQMLISMLLDVGAARQVEEVVADEFCVEEHGVLAAHLYRYYGEGGAADPARFLETVDDPAVRATVTSLLMEHDRRQEEGRDGWDLDTCFATWKLAKLESRRNEVQARYDEAARSGDVEAMYRLHEELKSLREAIDELKNRQKHRLLDVRTEGGIRR
ncbi:MAG: DNA primase [Alicyclobacillaceae bacterium]|nr:DNA primase [Alicyclobacillaceae bacterium]